jgi:hypothetical protein
MKNDDTPKKPEDARNEQGAPERPLAPVFQLASRTARINRAKRDAEAVVLMRISDEIDQVIIKHLEAGDVDPRDLAGLLAHRLGTLMRHQEQKTILWDVCERVLKAQAAIE